MTTKPTAVEAHIRKTIDRNIELTPQLAKRLGHVWRPLSELDLRHVLR